LISSPAGLDLDDRHVLEVADVGTLTSIVRSAAAGEP
jgi:hypothetical protein